MPAEERTVTDVVAKVRERRCAALERAGARARAPVLLGRALADALGVGVGRRGDA